MRCAVHYVKTDDRFRYRVVPAGERLVVPSEEELQELGQGSTLADWAAAQEWARSWDRPYRGPEGDTGWAQRVSVHVGMWPTETVGQERWTTARFKRNSHLPPRDHLRPEPGLADWLEMPVNPSSRYARASQEEYRKALRVLQKAAPKATLGSEAVDGPLETILQSGRFRVSGQVSFHPLQPFQPAPTFPKDDDRFVAFEEIEFTYP